MHLSRLAGSVPAWQPTEEGPLLLRTKAMASTGNQGASASHLQ
eukprot:gene2809-12686_t